MSCRRDVRAHAFSLLEVMAVLVIIGLIVGLATVNIRSSLATARINAAKIDIQTLMDAIETYATVEGRYPTSDEGIELLTEPTANQPEPLRETVPMDPWRRPYEYIRPGHDAPFDIYSLGADGMAGGEGIDADISSEDLRKGPETP